MDSYATYTTRILPDGRAVLLRWVHGRVTGAAVAVLGLPPEVFAFGDDPELIAAGLGDFKAPPKV